MYDNSIMNALNIIRFDEYKACAMIFNNFDTYFLRLAISVYFACSVLVIYTPLRSGLFQPCLIFEESLTQALVIHNILSFTY